MRLLIARDTIVAIMTPIVAFLVSSEVMGQLPLHWQVVVYGIAGLLGISVNRALDGKSVLK